MHGLAVPAFLLCGVLAASPAAFAQSSERSEAKPESKSRTIQLRAKNPDPAKWTGRRDGQNPRTIYDCKQGACATRVRVIISASKGPTKPVTEKALEKLAREDLPKAARAANAAREIMTDGAEKIETLASEPVRLHGFPAVLNETGYSRATVTVYKGTAIIFAGPAMVRVEATSSDRALMKKSLEEFIRVMEFEEREPTKKPLTNPI
jgi:hypothetical protein